MGCGNSNVSNSHFFSVHLLCCEKFENRTAIIKEKVKENKKVIEKMTVAKYVYSTFLKQFKELLENSKIIKNCLFYLYCQGKKTKKFLEYNDIYNLIPFDEVLIPIDTNGLIQKLYIIDIRSILQLNIKPEYLKSQLNDDYEIIGKKIDIPISQRETERIKQEEEDKIGEEEAANINSDDEKEVEDGVKIDIYRELNAESLKSYIVRLENEKVTSFRIKGNHFYDIKMFKALVAALSNCVHLRTFVFSDNHNTTGFDEGWDIIINFIKSNKTIRNLNLSMSFLYDKHLSKLIQEGLKWKKIVNLDLSSNFITIVGCRKIAEWLSKNKSLKTLSLQQNTMNEFKKDGCDIICSQLINHNRIISLDVSNMILTGLGEKIAELIRQTSTLKILKIRNTRMNLDDFKFIKPALIDNTTIIELNIGENNCGIDKSIEYISNIVQSNKTIKTLNLDNIGLNKKNAHMLHEALKCNETIENYSFNDNVKFRFKLLYDMMINVKFLKILSAVNIKQHKDDIGLIENFKKEREDVSLKI